MEKVHLHPDNVHRVDECFNSEDNCCEDCVSFTEDGECSKDLFPIWVSEFFENNVDADFCFCHDRLTEEQRKSIADDRKYDEKVDDKLV